MCFLYSRGSDGDLVVRSDKVQLQCVNWNDVRPQNVLCLEVLAAVQGVHSSHSQSGPLEHLIHWSKCLYKTKADVHSNPCLYFFDFHSSRNRKKTKLGSFLVGLRAWTVEKQRQPQAPVSAEWASKTSLMNNVIISVLQPQYLSESQPWPQLPNTLRSAVCTRIFPFNCAS